MGKKMLSLIVVAIILAALVCATAVACKTFVFKKPEIDPGFLGALIGAAGTIFAGYMVLMTTNEQIRIAKDSAAQAIADKANIEKMNLEFRQQAAARELRGLKDLVVWYDRLLRSFDNLPNSGVPYLDAAAALQRSGDLVSFTGQPPQEFSGTASMAWQGLLQVSNAVVNWQNQHPDPATRSAGERGEYDARVRRMVEEIRGYREAAKAEIEKRTAGSR
jgi:hypothetical protein